MNPQSILSSRKPSPQHGRREDETCAKWPAVWCSAWAINQIQRS